MKRNSMLTLEEIASLVNGKLNGDGNVRIKNLSTLEDAEEGDISFISEEKYLKKIKESKASAFIVKEGLKVEGKPFIEVINPYLAVAKILEKIVIKETHPIGIHPTSIISKSAKIGKDPSIYPYVIIDNNVEIGDNVVIYPFTYIGINSKIGNNSLIYSNVVIRENVIIGERVIIHSGTCIGSDGFGYTKLEDGTHYKIPHVGGVIIEDDVEIGANVCIDRAMLKNTVIKKGTKIDNLVQIAHNCVISENSIIAGQVGLSGSVKLGKNVILAGQVGVADHLSIGDNSIVLAQSGVSKDIPENKTYWGYPAREVKEAWRTLAEIGRLSSLIEKVKLIEQKLKQIEERIK